jgi:hypothetical protein
VEPQERPVINSRGELIDELEVRPRPYDERFLDQIPLSKIREIAMFKFGLATLLAITITFASAHAFDNNYGADRAASYFGEFGLQGLAVAGRGRVPMFEGRSGYYAGTPDYGPAYAPPYAPARSPVCWVQYLTVENSNTLIPQTICR